MRRWMLVTALLALVVALAWARCIGPSPVETTAATSAPSELATRDAPGPFAEDSADIGRSPAPVAPDELPSAVASANPRRAPAGARTLSAGARTLSAGARTLSAGARALSGRVLAPAGAPVA